MSERHVGLRWAEDVIAIYESGGLADPEWSAARNELFNWATIAENKEKFYSQLVPKAAEIIQKFSGDEDGAFVAREERRSVGELKSILKETLASIK
jgi:hypothetical protein